MQVQTDFGMLTHEPRRPSARRKKFSYFGKDELRKRGLMAIKDRKKMSCTIHTPGNTSHLMRETTRSRKSDNQNSIGSKKGGAFKQRRTTGPSYGLHGIEEKANQTTDQILITR